MSLIKEITFVLEKIASLSVEDIEKLKSEVEISDSTVGEIKKIQETVPGVSGVMIKKFQDGEADCEPYYNYWLAHCAYSEYQQFTWTKD
ncbi:MAG TPA: hypothetical protein PK526_03975 [bacterium]|nr:hypothetical protein [bacterium]